MNHVLAAVICITLISQPCFAIADRTKDFCRAFSNTAEAAMYARQNGTAMSTLMDHLKGGGPLKNEIVKSLVEDVVMEAYSSPRHTSENTKHKAIQDFRDSWHLKCLKYDWR